MSAKVIQLNARRCPHRMEGHCGLKLAHDPDYYRKWSCKVLERWDQEFDAHLYRAEQFQLPADLAIRIFERKLTRLLDQDTCEGITGGKGSLLSCPHFRDGLCLLRIPPCEGDCPGILFQTDEKELRKKP